jgi:putative transposase
MACESKPVLAQNHSVSVLLYHFVCPAKYRSGVFRPGVEQELKADCVLIEKTYEIVFLDSKFLIHVWTLERHSKTKTLTLECILQTRASRFSGHYLLKQKSIHQIAAGLEIETGCTRNQDFLIKHFKAGFKFVRAD